MNQCRKGRNAEHAAAAYLKTKGYRIWKTNWRWGKRELDLVALHRQELVIVEVKSRFGNAVNDPSAVVDRTKERNIVLAAEAFIRLHNCSYPTRFDVIAIIYGACGMEIEHMENAFYPTVD